MSDIGILNQGTSQRSGLMERIVAALRESEDIDQIKTLLKSLGYEHREKLAQPSPELIGTYATAIKTLYSVEIHVDQFRELIQPLFSTLTGVNSIITEISALVFALRPADDSIERLGKDYRTNVGSYTRLNFLCYVLSLVLTPQCHPFKVLLSVGGDQPKSSQRSFQNEVTQLFLGSKILNSTTAAYQLINQYYHLLSLPEADRLQKWEWVASPVSYSKGLAEDIIGLTPSHTSAGLLSRCLRLGDQAPDAILEKLYQEGLVDKTAEIYRLMHRPDQVRFVGYMLSFFEKKIIAAGADPERLNVLSNILSLFISSAEAARAAIETAVNKFGLASRQIIVGAVSLAYNNKAMIGECTDYLFRRWADPLTIKKETVSAQYALTECIYLFKKHSPQGAFNVTPQASLFDGVGKHLESSSARVRYLGIVIASDIIAQGGEKFKFDLDELLDNDTKQWRQGLLSSFDPVPLSSSQIKEIINSWHTRDTIEPTVAEERNTESTTYGNTDQVKPASSIYSEEPDSDDEEDFKPYIMDHHDPEDEDDDPTLVDREKVPPPVYIKTLIEYCKSENYRKIKIGLENAASLIRRKANFGQEVELHAKALADLFVGIGDQFDMEGFNDMKLNALIALVSSSPKIVAPHMTKLLFTGDYSLQQRMVILSALSLGARDLAGMADDNGNIKRSIAKRLPPEIEQLFSLPSTNGGELDSVTHRLQSALLSETTEKAKDELIGAPQVLRVSKKLENARERTKVVHTKNAYAKLAGRYFVFPLTAQWHRSGGVAGLGVYSEIMTGHFLKTLALLLHAAYPNSPDLMDITMELMQIVTGQRQHIEVPDVVMEGLMTVLLVVMEVHTSEVLATEFGGPVVEIMKWLETNWTRVTDDRIRSLTAGVLFQLNEIIDKHRRRLIDRFAGIQ
ncbi:hypothetical protein TRVA0_037S00826 [Trichomonascus vanleenenianus]|uniref:Tel2p n=1 Tax=Trichomonascus vanleenenianus TaxID=2268995 RepID=UPI003ECB5110